MTVLRSNNLCVTGVGVLGFPKMEINKNQLRYFQINFNTLAPGYEGDSTEGQGSQLSLSVASLACF